MGAFCWVKQPASLRHYLRTRRTLVSAFVCGLGVSKPGLRALPKKKEADADARESALRSGGAFLGGPPGTRGHLRRNSLIS
jgi:hypothetical protein